MKNFVQPGKILTLTSPIGGVISGTVYQIEDLIVVATVTAAAGESFAAFVGPGVITYAKAPSEAWSEGEKIYWDDGDGVFTTDDDTGSNPLVGVATAAVAGGVDDIVGTVRLDGVAR
jgi:predicted RecA/RadA family phage recombinase